MINSRHPEFEIHREVWEMLRDFSQGEMKVKAQGAMYLPVPTGFAAQGLYVHVNNAGPENWSIMAGRDTSGMDKGLTLYSQYIQRAQFPDILSPTMQGMVGLIHRIEPEITGLEKGKPLAFMMEKCSIDGLTLELFHQRITSEILLQGRYSILVDVPSTGGQPYFAGYTAEQLINWSDVEKDLFILDETRYERNVESEFQWTRIEHYRALRLIDGVYHAQVYTFQTPGDDYVPNMAAKGGTFGEIPFVVTGPRDLRIAPVESPLYGVGRACLAIYRLDADYRHQLYMTGQETLFIMGLTDDLPSATGAGVVIGLPPNSDAKYVGPKGVGIEAHRKAIEDERNNAINAGLKLFDKGERESGEALRLRSAAQTTTLTMVAKASAAALERALRYAAMFVGQDPNEITVKPNLRFVDTVMTPQDALYLVQVWQGGAISQQTLYENLQRGEIASDERVFEEEQKLIHQEEIDRPQPVQIDPKTGLPIPRPNGPGGSGKAPALPNARTPDQLNKET